jgi:hypothetical protein
MVVRRRDLTLSIESQIAVRSASRTGCTILQRYCSFISASGTHFYCRAIKVEDLVLLGELGKLENVMISSGFEPATVRLVP